MAGEDIHALVVDNGSAIYKAGVAGEHTPRAVFPSVIGQTSGRTYNRTWEHRDFYVGSEAQIIREALSLSYPIKNGKIKNWDDVEIIWHHTFYNELRVSPEEHAVLIAEPTILNNNGDNSSRYDREKTAEIFFEKFRSPAVYFADQSVLSLYATGRTNGVVFDTGGDYSKSAPIIDGQIIRESSCEVKLGGHDLDKFLKALLLDRKDVASNSLSDQTIADIKEQYFYLAPDYGNELDLALGNPSITKTYVLPDGKSFSIANERFICPEVLFTPSLINKNVPGFHNTVLNSILYCDASFHDDLFNNIVLCGGTSMLPGLSRRMQSEIRALAPLNTKVRTVTEEYKKYLAWVGGSMLASLPSFHHTWITKNKFEENRLNENTR